MSSLSNLGLSNGTNNILQVKGNTFVLPASQTSPTAGTTSTATAGTAGAADGNTGAALQLLQGTVNIIQQLINGGGSGTAGTAGSTGLGGTVGTCACGINGCPGCTLGSGAAQGPGITTPMPGASSAPAASVAQINGVNDQNLQQSLNLLATDPEGQVLLSKAQQLGVSIKVGDTGGANVLGFYDDQTNSITIGNGNNLKTLAHELVHAVSKADGDSQTEEGLANVIGKRIESRLRGTPLEDPQTTFNNTLPNYKNLSQNNGIRNTLAQLGIQA